MREFVCRIRGAMKLSASARRIISYGVSRLKDEEALAAWSRWQKRHPDGELPTDIVAIAARSIAILESEILGAIATKKYAEEMEGDILNDLGYVRAIESDLRKERMQQIAS
jgi:hypothetical protein